MFARLIATAVHEVVREYRRLDGGGADGGESVNCTSVDTERAEPDESRHAVGFSLPASPEAREAR